MPFHLNLWTRRGHRWGSVLIALPFLVVLVTGILLQLKKEWTWVQPPTAKGATRAPEISFASILDAARSVPEAEVSGWEDIERLDVRPDKGIVKLQSLNRWEVQIDTSTAEVLQVAYRRSDLIEALHDGSWFHESARLWVFLPSAVVVLGLWITGMYLFVLPQVVKRRRRRQKAMTVSAAAPARSRQPQEA